jgi:hypothetical protein
MVYFKIAIPLLMVTLISACDHKIQMVSKADFDAANQACVLTYQQEKKDEHALAHFAQCQRQKVMPYMELLFPARKNDIEDLYNSLEVVADTDDREHTGPQPMLQYFHLRREALGLRTEVICQPDHPCVISPQLSIRKVPKID